MIGKYLSTIIVILCCGFLARGQIVNIESKRFEDDMDGWFGSVDFNLNYTKNTKEVWQGGNRVRVQRNKSHHSFLILSDLSLVRVNSDFFLNRGFAHFRFDQSFNEKERFWLEAFQQGMYNQIQRMKFRSLTGIGARYEIFDNDSLDLSIGVAGMYEYEEITDPENLETPTSQLLRLSSYLAFDVNVGKVMRFNTIVYYQPAAADFSDYRISNESTLFFHISNHLSFKVIYSMVYDAKPPINVHHLNSSLKNALSFNF